MELNGSEILIECLLEQGVDTIFGYPGGAVLFIYDALYKYQDKIKHYLVSHEQGAAHAADGYARSTGKPGVCLATSGPGATNLVTGIATAYMDSVPMVAITGNVTLPLLGKDSFQEVDIAGITMPITKHNFIVKDVTKLAETIRRAFYIAQEGRPGPVLIDITKDVTANRCDFERQAIPPIPRKIENIRQKDLATATELIHAAQKPLIYAGGGVVISGANHELVQLADRMDAPVCVSSMGLGGFPASDPRFIGMIGMHGTKTASLAATECDLLVAVGARFSDRVISNVKRFAPQAKIVHIDVDPAEINKNIFTHCAVVGDIKVVLERLLVLLSPVQHPNWMEHIKESKAQYPLQYKDDGSLKVQYILQRINALIKTKGPSIIVTEVGQHQMWAYHYVDYEEPRTLISSGGLGTMGYGLGAAIGAKIANPDKIVFNIAGDGCFRMNNVEIATAVEYNIPIIVVIMNNHALGMVRQWQKLFYDGRYSQTNLDGGTDFVKLAEAHGALGLRITKPEEVDDVLQKAIAANRPVVINCETSKNENVFPMVPAGAGIDEILLD